MSELLVNTIKKADGTGSLTVPAESGTVVTTASPSLGRRNLIINGAMQVAQRGTSLSLAHDGTTNGYVADRFQFVMTGTADSLDGTLAQVSDAPDGYSNSLKWTTGTAESTAADEAVYLHQKIEAQNLQHLGYGNSTASSITASFWVKSSQTGVFAVSMYVPDGPRNIGTTYTINAANTWEQKTITFVGDTGGTINNDNGIGIQFVWHLATGSNFNSSDNTSWGAYTGGRWGYGHVQNGVTETASATWQITGVQLEVGSVVSSYEHRSFGDELALCQRYYEKFTGLLQYSKARESDRLRYINFFYKQVKRGTPSISISGTADGTSFVNFADNSTDAFRGQCTATGDGATPFFTSVTLDAEL
jgi:hypothetical protein